MRAEPLGSDYRNVSDHDRHAPHALASVQAAADVHQIFARRRLHHLLADKSEFGKTDFNFDVPPDAFDVRTDWTKQKPKEPFFGFHNILWSHESKVRADAAEYAQLTRKLTPAERHDPKKMFVPPFYPDAPEVRHDIAQYYDLVTAVDKQMGEVLKTLDQWGVASNTLILDHRRSRSRHAKI